MTDGEIDDRVLDDLAAQALAARAHAYVVLVTPGGARTTLEELLPRAFGPSHLGKPEPGVQASGNAPPFAVKETLEEAP